MSPQQLAPDRVCQDMAVIPYTFVVDIKKKRLLDSLGSLATADTPRFFRGDTAAVTVRMVVPTGAFDDPTPARQFPVGAQLLVAIGVPGRSADVLASVGPLAVAADAVEVSAVIGTSDIVAALRGKASSAAHLELRLIESDGTKTVLAQVECEVVNVVTLDTATTVEATTLAGLAIAGANAAAALAAEKTALCVTATAGAATATAATTAATTDCVAKTALCVTATTNAAAATASATTATTGANTAAAAADAATASAASATAAATSAAASANTAAANANAAAENANAAAAGIQYGKSAYDLAVDNGFSGTESEWLDSLKGVFSGSGGVVAVTASRALAASDNGKLLVISGSTAYTLTHAAGTLSPGFVCELCQLGAAPLTVDASGGASVVNAYDCYRTRRAGSVASLRVAATDVALLAGDLRV